MERNEYKQIRQWLYQYSDWETRYRDYYKQHSSFLTSSQSIKNNLSNKNINGIKEASKKNHTLGLPSYGLFEIQPTNNIYVNHQISSDEMINHSYDLGIFKHPRYTIAERHTHDYYELAYVLEGQAHQTLWAGGTKHQLALQEGGFLLIPPSVSHEVYVNDESILLNLLIRKKACEEALLHNLPDNSELIEFFRRALYSENPLYIILQTDNASELQECFFDLLIENYGDGYYRRKIANLKMSILFLNMLSRTSLSIDLYNKEMKDFDYIPAIINYMEQNYASTTPQQIADAFGFSRAHLGRIYKRHAGSTLQDSLFTIRMRKAETLLIQSDYSVQQIGQMVGYDDVTNFIRRFRAHKGKTPHQYRLSSQ